MDDLHRHLVGQWKLTTSYRGDAMRYLLLHPDGSIESTNATRTDADRLRARWGLHGEATMLRIELPKISRHYGLIDEMLGVVRCDAAVLELRGEQIHVAYERTAELGLCWQCNGAFQLSGPPASPGLCGHCHEREKRRGLAARTLPSTCLGCATPISQAFAKNNGQRCRACFYRNVDEVAIPSRHEADIAVIEQAIGAKIPELLLAHLRDPAGRVVDVSGWRWSLDPLHHMAKADRGYTKKVLPQALHLREASPPPWGRSMAEVERIAVAMTIATRDGDHLFLDIRDWSVWIWRHDGDTQRQISPSLTKFLGKLKSETQPRARTVASRVKEHALWQGRWQPVAPEVGWGTADPEPSIVLGTDERAERIYPSAEDNVCLGHWRISGRRILIRVGTYEHGLEMTVDGDTLLAESGIAYQRLATID